MKIRNGFVSNSSSSSFIIEKSALPEDLSVETIKKVVFNNNSQVRYEYGDELLDTDTLSSLIYRELEESLGKDKKEIQQELMDMLQSEFYWDVSESVPDVPGLRRDLSKEEAAKIREAQQKRFERISAICEEKALEMLKEYKDVVIIEYSDDEMYGTHLEHSGIIEEAFNARRISHH